MFGFLSSLVRCWLSQFPDPDELLCPITLELFADPCITRTGHTFEKHAIVKHMSNAPNARPLCPVTGLPLNPADPLFPNIAMRHAVTIWKETKARKVADALQAEQSLAKIKRSIASVVAPARTQSLQQSASTTTAAPPLFPPSITSMMADQTRLSAERKDSPSASASASVSPARSSSASVSAAASPQSPQGGWQDSRSLLLGLRSQSATVSAAPPIPARSPSTFGSPSARADILLRRSRIAIAPLDDDQPVLDLDFDS